MKNIITIKAVKDTLEYIIPIYANTGVIVSFKTFKFIQNNCRELLYGSEVMWSEGPTDNEIEFYDKNGKWRGAKILTKEERIIKEIIE